VARVQALAHMQGRLWAATDNPGLGCGDAVEFCRNLAVAGKETMDRPGPGIACLLAGVKHAAKAQTGRAVAVACVDALAKLARLAGEAVDGRCLNVGRRDAGKDADRPLKRAKTALTAEGFVWDT
jgi:hypothetical protein